MSTQATWPVFMAALQSRQAVAERTVAFRFDKPSDWTFMAGQFVDITLVHPTETDAEGHTRGFSIASAPCEDTLMITTRMRDTAFKRVLKTLPLGTAVKIEGPFGELRLPHNTTRPAVVLSGGIGITPFRSIFVQAAHERSLQRIVFFNANRRPEDAPFIPTMTKMGSSCLPWDGRAYAPAENLPSTSERSRLNHANRYTSEARTV